MDSASCISTLNILIESPVFLLKSIALYWFNKFSKSLVLIEGCVVIGVMSFSICLLFFDASPSKWFEDVTLLITEWASELLFWLTLSACATLK